MLGMLWEVFVIYRRFLKLRISWGSYPTQSKDEKKQNRKKHNLTQFISKHNMSICSNQSDIDFLQEESTTDSARLLDDSLELGVLVPFPLVPGLRMIPKGNKRQKAKQYFNPQSITTFTIIYS